MPTSFVCSCDTVEDVGCAAEGAEGVSGLRREYARSKARHLEEVRREAQEAEEQAQLLQQDMQRKVHGRPLQQACGFAYPRQELPDILRNLRPMNKVIPS